MANKFTKEMKFGIYAIITIGCILFGLNYMSGSQFFGPPLVLYAKYSNVEGLLSGNYILINGLKVGKVGNMQLDMNEGLATVRLEFDRELDIPENSEAMIYNIDLLGTKGIKIWVPDSLQPSPVFLEDNAEIKGTIESGVFDAASDLIEGTGAQILVEVAELSVKLNEIVRLTQDLLTDTDNSNSLRVIISNIKDASDNLTSISSEVDSIAQEMTGISRNAASIVDNFEDNNDNITTIIGNVRGTTDTLVSASTEIRQLIYDAGSAVGSVESMVSKLDTTTGTLGLLLNDRQLYDSLTSTTENVNAMLREVKRNPQRFFDDIKIYLIERKKK